MCISLLIADSPSVVVIIFLGPSWSRAAPATIHLLLLPTSLPSPHALYSYLGMRLLSFFILLLFITRRTRTHALFPLFFFLGCRHTIGCN
ncbi:hypothetical protein DFH06DRAFT_1154729 [Mycena polygramma]|nr:hypothetical protein DFH06DRAFT_1154729 [Mycena polygramma]